MNSRDITIWTSTPDYEEYRQVMEEDLPWASESERRVLFERANMASLATQREEMSVSLGAPIVCAAEYTWSGMRVTGLDIIAGGNLADCFRVPEDCDSVRWFVDEAGELRSEERSGELTVRRLYRLAPGHINSDAEDIASIRTVRLGDALSKIYGFELPEKKLSAY